MLASTDYEKALDDIKNDAKKLGDEKKTYEDLVSVSGEDVSGLAAQYQKYEIEYLWAVIGNHATSEGIELKMDLVSGVQSGTYNLNFTVRGSYIGLSDFISTIENDPVLGFKIENFNMVPGGSTEQLQATFTCKNIQIILSQKDNSESTDTTTSQSTSGTQTSENTIQKIDNTFKEATEQTKNANQATNDMLNNY